MTVQKPILILFLPQFFENQTLSLSLSGNGKATWVLYLHQPSNPFIFCAPSIYCWFMEQYVCIAIRTYLCILCNVTCMHIV